MMTMKLVLLAVIMTACSSPQAKAREAAATYAADQLACVDNAMSRVDADACRAKVRAEWSKDGGK